MKEIWKTVIDNQYYLVSNKGRVKSLVSNKILSPHITKKGYLRLGLYYYDMDEQVNRNQLDKRGRVRKTLKRFGRRGRPRRKSVHQLVLLAFVKKPKGSTMINHKDGNKMNNCIDNLEWCNNSRNMTHAYRNGLIRSRSGEKASNVKLKESDILEIRKDVELGLSDSEIGKKFRVTASNIYRIRKDQTWRCVVL